MECPENEYVTCPEKEGNIATPTPTDNYAGEYRCNTCSYACNNDTGHYTEETECTAAHQGWLCAMDVPSGCYKTSTCDEANHFYNKQESCEEYYNGYSCTLSAGCYVKGGEKPCPSEPEQEYTACPSKEGNKVTPTPTENMSGAKQCYTCAYTCDETNKYYTLKDSCEKANPEQFCSLNDASGCYKPSGCNTAAGFYEEQKDCEAANTGYACELRDKCYVKGDAKDCPVGEYLTGKCPSKTGNDVSESPSGSMSGENQCFTCIYTCKVSDKYYPDNGSCQTANPGKACVIEAASGYNRVTG